MNTIALASVVFLSVLHVLADMLRWKRHIPQKYWMSFADGISISYVFLGLLPKILHGTEQIPHTRGLAGVLKDAPFIPLLVGLVTFYGLERLVQKAPPGEPGPHAASEPTELRVWSHLASYAVYKAIIGYVIVQMEDPFAIAFFVLSMAVHFLVVDYRMMEIHKGAYQRIGRWVLTGAILAGGALGMAVVLPPLLVTPLLGFVAGGVVLVVLEEEFSREHPSSFYAFVAAVVGYTALQIAI